MKTCPACKKTLPFEFFYKHKLTKDGYRTYCKLCTKEKAAQWQKDNRERKNELNRQWRSRNPEKARQSVRDFRASRPGWASEQTKKYLKKYPWRNSFNCSKRHTDKMNRTPEWADMDAIKFFYECKPAGCHVDHVIPLRGKNISGLHIETNLQWLLAEDNVRKNNVWT